MSEGYDLIILGGIVIDGSGKPGRLTDIGIRNGRIVTVGKVDGDGDEKIDATGRGLRRGSSISTLITMVTRPGPTGLPRRHSMG